MSPDELRNHLLLHGVRCKVRRTEVMIETCVYCGNTKYNLELNPGIGAFHCWTCGKGGRVDGFLKEVTGLTIHIPVTGRSTGAPGKTRVGVVLDAAFLGDPAVDVPHISSYLHTRHISGVDMAVYQIKAGRGGIWENRAVMPLLEYWSRQVVGYVGRTVMPNERPKYFTEWYTPTKWITGHRTRSEIHVVVEGPFDGIMVHRAGFNTAVLAGTAATKGVLEEWSARAPFAHDVVVLLDGEAAAEGKKLYWRIRPIHEKVYVGVLPVGVDPAQLDPRVITQFVQATIRRNSCS